MEILDLMKIEFQRIKIKRTSEIKIFVIISSCILLMTIMISEIGGIILDTMSIEESKELFLDAPSGITRMVYLIYMAVLLNKVIISEFYKYEAKNIFIYPYSRRNIILSKLFCVCSIIFIEMIVTVVVQYAFLRVLSPNIFLEYFGGVDGVTNILKLLLSLVATVIFGTIALYFGFILKSHNATIVTSILLISFGIGRMGELSLSDYMLTPIVLSLIGVFLTMMLLKKISHMDIL